MTRRVVRALVAASAALAACGDDGPSTDGIVADAPADGFDRNAMLGHLGADVLRPMQAAFTAKATALPAAIGAYCTALDSGAAGTTLATARTAWAETVDAWQLLDAVLVGPAAMDGKTIRDRIYAWPLVSPCGINRDTSARWAEPGSYDAALQPVNERSLLAIEFLLYTTETAHGCPTEPAGWTAVMPALPRARCRLAEQIAIDVAANATVVDTGWSTDGDDYAAVLASAGQSGSVFASTQEALNLISDSFFYSDRMIKDMKLAQPAGIVDNACGTVQAPCIREVELQLSDRAAFAIRANLRGLRAVFTGTPALAGGTDGPGFDDLIRAVGAPDLADRMTANLDAAVAAADALPDGFVAGLSSDYATYVAAHASVKAITDDLKTQFLTVLALEIPDDVATDND